ncbi:hypothetical protein AB0F73_00690 [Micromonospora purpureochromogenes]
MVALAALLRVLAVSAARADDRLALTTPALQQCWSTSVDGASDFGDTHA